MLSPSDRQKYCANRTDYDEDKTATREGHNRPTDTVLGETDSYAHRRAQQEDHGCSRVGNELCVSTPPRALV
jgi:hypothetical protein